MDAQTARLVRTVTQADGADDRVAVEEPLEIRVNGAPLAVTMRTPGHDEELAIGFLLGEGLLAHETPVHAAPPPDLAANTVDVRATLTRAPAPRAFYTSSSCGICGKGSIEEVAVHAPALPAGPAVSRALLAALPELLVQPGFALTGGLHATGLFTTDGVLLVAHEDVGRHNAMDKVIGAARLEGALPLHGHVLCVSGRLSFELVQKAAVAGAPVLVGVGAPSSLAIELAADRGMTLAGFARGSTVNVYADGPGRVTEP